VLFGRGGSFVSLGNHPRFLGGNYLYRPGWQIGDGHRAFLPVTFIEGHVRKSNNLTMLVGFSKLPHGFDFLEAMSMLLIAPVLMRWKCQVPRLGHSFKAHHVIIHHCGERYWSFKHQLNIVFIKPHVLVDLGHGPLGL
jgi:hypothetical protein